VPSTKVQSPKPSIQHFINYRSYQVLSTRSIEFQVSSTKYWVPSIEYWVLSSRLQILNTKHWILSST
jgi:hypothetical protein